MHYVYVLKSKVDNKLYIGSISNLKRRFAEHNKRLSSATKNRAPVVLVYYEAYVSKTDALGREKKLKQFKNSYTRLKERIEKSLSA